MILILLLSGVALSVAAGVGVAAWSQRHVDRDMVVRARAGRRDGYITGDSEVRP